MAGDSSEEKNLPASAKKLRDARGKGQIAKAPDLLTALSGVAVIGYLYGSIEHILELMRNGISTTGDTITLPFHEAIRLIFAVLGDMVLEIVGPVLALTLTAVVLGSMLLNGGFMLVTDPLMPKLETLDPIKGIGKLFKMKAFVELLKSILKAIVLGTITFKMALAASPALVHLPGCGPRCLGPVTSEMLRPLISVACLVYIVAGVADLLLQKWLFARDMKMSVTEQKRERKDQDGDPHVRRAQRQRRREAATSPQLGVDRASLILGGDDAAIGLRYKRGETDFPVVVCRTNKPEGASAMIAHAREVKTPVFWDNDFALQMCAKMKPGDRIAPEFFQRVAQALYSTGVVRGG